jgi:uncharacterized protein YjbJ (UPF0337 family)
VLDPVAVLSLLYDHREERSGIPRMLRAAGLDARAAQLPVGDYVLSDRVVVERKSGADLAASIKDRRLFEQIERLAEAYEAVVLVVEGAPIHIAQSSWKGALARVLLSGAAVVATDDARDTADWLERLARLEGGGPAETPGRSRGDARLAVRRARRRRRLTTPGIRVGQPQPPPRGDDMSDGSMDKAKGHTKEAVGDLTGDEELKDEGKVDRASGSVKGAVGGVADKAKKLLRKD